jgi:MerR family transcriptional regulator, light-induced transcriptional regulator
VDAAAPAAPAGAHWTAGAVSRILGIPASTLRSWHRRYGIPAGTPHGGTHRRYSAADVEALTRMQRLVAAGLSPASAAAIVFSPAGPSERAPVPDPDALVDAVSRLDAAQALSLLEVHIAAHGVVEVWEQMCRPALNRLGGPAAPDVEGCIDVVQLLSWAVTVALHRVPAPPAAPGAPVVLLASVAGEHHTLPIEALRAALAQAATTAYLLGADNPGSALRGAVHRTRASALVLWAQSGPIAASTPLAELAADGAPLVLAGPGWERVTGPPGTPHPPTLPAAVELLAAPAR